MKFYMNHNRNKTAANQPDFRSGVFELNGVMMKAAAWQGTNSKGDYLSITIDVATAEDIRRENEYRARVAGGMPATPAVQSVHNQQKANGFAPDAFDMGDEIPFNGVV